MQERFIHDLSRGLSCFINTVVSICLTCGRTCGVELLSKKGEVSFDLFITLEKVVDLVAGVHGGGVITAADVMADGGIGAFYLFT